VKSSWDLDEEDKKNLFSEKALKNFETEVNFFKISQVRLFIGSAPLTSPPQKKCKLSLRVKFEAVVRGSKT